MRIYTIGGNSKPYSVLTVPALAASLNKGTGVLAQGEDGQPVSGTVYESALVGSNKVSILYDISTVQSQYVGCRVGALPPASQVRHGCINISYPVNVGGASFMASAVEHKNGRHLAGFSTAAQEKMWECNNGCPYEEYRSFYNYYGSHTYADDWVKGALMGSNVAFPNGRGSADFSRFNDDATRIEAAKKGTAYMNVWMYVVREFEDAIGDCENSCIECNDDPVHAWDEGVAFYTGSLVTPRATVDSEGPLFEGGNLIWTLMDKRCQNFKTCGAKGDMTTGTAKVNLDLANYFALGQHNLLLGQCEAANEIKDRVVDLMRVGLIQGTIRYAYKVGKLMGDLKEKAEGAVFAAAVLPALHKCSPEAAETVYSNMRLDATSTNFADVKSAFEKNYQCLGITCADVGGLWFDAIDDYYEGAQPCVDASASSLNGGAVAGIVIAVIVALGLLVVLMFVIFRERRGKPLFLNLDKMRT